MTPNELKRKLYELNYPAIYNVDWETYGRVCHEIFKNHIDNGTEGILIEGKDFFSFRVETGKVELGIKFKNVELIPPTE